MSGSPDKLTARWSKRENDILFHYPSSPDGHLLCGALAGFGVKDLHKELERRGYDLTTLRFSIAKKVTPEVRQ